MKESNLPLVTIIIPVYNVAEYIERCAGSLFAQTYRNIEILFINDMSPDNSIEILRKYIAAQRTEVAHKSRIISHRKNMGQACARNTGVENASGKYIMFVDSDDYLPSNAIELLMGKALETQSDIVRGNFTTVSPTGDVFHSYVYPDDKTKYINTLINWRTLPLSVWLAVYRRDFLLKNKINFFGGYDMGEDFYYSVMTSYFANRISSIPENVYFYVENMQSTTRNFSFKQADDFVATANLIKEFLSSKPEYNSYVRNLTIGRARIKAHIIDRMGKDRKKYMNVFPDLNDSTYLSLWGKLKLFAVVRFPKLYKLMNKVSPSF